LNDGSDASDCYSFLETEIDDTQQNERKVHGEPAAPACSIEIKEAGDCDNREIGEETPGIGALPMEAKEQELYKPKRDNQEYKKSRLLRAPIRCYRTGLFFH